MDTCQSTAPAPVGIVSCGRRPHGDRFACKATGTTDGVHWSVTWFRPGRLTDARADGLPWPRPPAD